MVTRFVRLSIVVVAAVLSLATAAAAGDPGPSAGPYTGYRPYYGGVCGWGQCYGYFAYPAYPQVNPGYRFSTYGYPPTSYQYGYQIPGPGTVPYSRGFNYGWSAKEGDVTGDQAGRIAQ